MNPCYEGYTTRAGTAEFVAASQFLGHETARTREPSVVSLRALLLRGMTLQTLTGAAACSTATNIDLGRIYVFTGSGIAPSTRYTLFIANLGDSRLILRRVLPLLMERAGAQVSAYSYDLEELALAEDEGAAVAEMKAMIVESYFLLKKEQESLGPLQRQHWAFLQRIVEEVG